MQPKCKRRKGYPKLEQYWIECNAMQMHKRSSSLTLFFFLSFWGTASCWLTLFCVYLPEAALYSSAFCCFCTSSMQYQQSCNSMAVIFYHISIFIYYVDRYNLLFLSLSYNTILSVFWNATVQSRRTPTIPRHPKLQQWQVLLNLFNIPSVQE